MQTEILPVYDLGSGDGDLFVIQYRVKLQDNTVLFNAHLSLQVLKVGYSDYKRNNTVVNTELEARTWALGIINDTIAAF